jgi:arginine/ornithine transport system permease protein
LHVARDVCANDLWAAEAFGTAAVIYLALTFTLVGGCKLLERRYLRHLASERRTPATAEVAAGAA